MKKKQLIVLVITLASLFGQYWINAGNTSLKKTGEVACREEVINYTLPPDFIFSIWGLIYIGFIIYAVYGLSNNGSRNVHMNKTAYPIALSIFLNLAWTVIVGAELWVWAYPLQWIMLIVAIIIMYKWEVHNPPLSKIQMLLSIPFALYAGWLTVAMIPFTADLLNKSGWDYEPFSPRTWALILYVVACLIIFLAYRKLKQPFYLLPLAWALFGFFIRFDGALKFSAAILAFLVVVYFFIELPRYLRHRKLDRRE